MGQTFTHLLEAGNTTNDAFCLVDARSEAKVCPCTGTWTIWNRSL